MDGVITYIYNDYKYTNEVGESNIQLLRSAEEKHFHLACILFRYV